MQSTDFSFMHFVLFSNLAGMSSKGIAMSEKHADIEFGVESRAGIPFHFLMRDVIQFDNSLEDAIRYVIGGVVPAGHYLL